MITSEEEEQVIFVVLPGKGYRATLQSVGKLYIYLYNIIHTYYIYMRTHTWSSIARVVYFMYFNIYVLLRKTQKHIKKKMYRTH